MSTTPINQETPEPITWEVTEAMDRGTAAAATRLTAAGPVAEMNNQTLSDLRREARAATATAAQLVPHGQMVNGSAVAEAVELLSATPWDNSTFRQDVVHDINTILDYAGTTLTYSPSEVAAESETSWVQSEARSVIGAHDRLEAIAAAAGTTIFTAPDCDACAATARSLDQAAVSYDALSTAEHPELAESLASRGTAQGAANRTNQSMAPRSPSAWTRNRQSIHGDRDQGTSMGTAE